MEKAKLELFDISAHIIPGCIILLSVFISMTKVSNIEEVVSKLLVFSGGLNFYQLILILFISFLLGFIMHLFGHKYFELIAKRVWKRRVVDLEKSPYTNEEKYTLIRHHSASNFIYIAKWFAFRAMSFNLALSLIVLGGSVGICAFFNSLPFFVPAIIVVFCVLSSLVCLRRAVTFHQWSHEVSNASLKFIIDNEKSV